jgi:hypothetical protein
MEDQDGDGKINIDMDIGDTRLWGWEVDGNWLRIVFFCICSVEPVGFANIVRISLQEIIC